MTRTLTVVAVGFAAAVLGLLAFPLLVMAAVTSEWSHEPTPAALEDIPAPYLRLYQDAAASRCPGLPWSVLAAVGKVESDHGRLGGATLTADGTVRPWIIGPALDGTSGTRRILDTDGGRYDRDTVYDRAVGPMQFIPSTWRAYGIDAAGTGTSDPHNAIDTIHTAAVYLCAHGADDPERLRDALLAYNRSQEYVDLVLYHAARYGWGAGEIVPASQALIVAVLANPNLEIYEAGRDDIASGRIDARVLQMLQVLSERHDLRVISLQSGHSRCIGGVDYPGCRVSHHWHGRAVDISHLDGRPVATENSDARAIVSWLADLDVPLRPSEVGHPFPEFSPLPGFFTDEAHSRHLHLGWNRAGS